MDRKKQVLAVLIVLWAGVVVYQMATRDVPQQVPLKQVPGEVIQGTRALERHGGLMIRMDLIKNRARTFLGNPRNIFAPVQKGLSYPVEDTLRQQVPVTEPLPSLEQLALERAKRNLSQFRYLGFFSKGGEGNQAFLARGSKLFIVRRGDSVNDSIRIVGLTTDYVILREENTRVEMTLTLSSR